MELPPPFDREDAAVRRSASDYQEAARKNIEGFAGTARVPIGLAGPVDLHGTHGDASVHVTMATTEGTLVASTSRGMKVLNLSGGVTTRVTRPGCIQRAPVFELAGIAESLVFARALEADWSFLGPVVQSKTRHGQLRDVRCFVQGRYVHVRLDLLSGDAAGQNMVSIAAAACVEALVARNPSIVRAWMEGGFSGEKVPAALNRLYGRGRSAVASASIPASVLRQITRAEARNLPTLFTLYVNASSWAGNHNTHASLINVLPALFIATGQDVACVSESSVGQNFIDYDPATDLLRWEVVCPNLVLGTVGGGTQLPTQRECLEAMGCLGEHGADRLAEICAATALANEISFWSAIVADEWVGAHAKLRDR